jgi:excinuclease ABC subunit C
MDESQLVGIPLERPLLNELLPSTNGIYIFSRKGKFLYIGKSVNIKARVISHIESAKIDNKEAAIISNSDTVSYFITDSEFNALLLESRLINTHKPRYNVRWMDDKSYLYVKITVRNTYPQVFLARKRDDRKSKFFGPFPSVRAAEELIKAIRRVFPFDTQTTIGKRPCFYSKIGQCSPCPSLIEKEEDPSVKKTLLKEYKRNVKRVVQILEGKYDLLLTDMYAELKRLSEEQLYEEAIELRDRIARFEFLIKGRSLDRNLDNGSEYNRAQQGLEKLHSMLTRYFPDMPLPHRIECYDISNTSQKEITASMVVMTEGIVDKSQYRKFRIKDVTVQSDFEAMHEVLGRRIKRDGWDKPDLLVVDGGKPQVRTALETLGAGGYDVPVIGIAKNPDRLVIGTHDMTTIRPPVNHPGFNLIRALRDESHRFAKKYHVYLRNKKVLSGR